MRKRFSRIIAGIALLVYAWVLPSVVYAQYGPSTGGIIGTVVDEQGSVLPVVRVIVKGPGSFPQKPATSSFVRDGEME